MDTENLKKEARKTEQELLPLNKPLAKTNQYDIYPTRKISQGHISHDLAELFSGLPATGNLIIDGYVGVDWEAFVAHSKVLLAKTSVDWHWINVADALKPAAEIEEMIHPYLHSDGQNSIFGKAFSGAVSDFFDAEKLEQLQPSETRSIIYGTGAALAGWEGTLIYLDIPKNEIQFRSRAGRVLNVGANETADPKAQYKRFYFVDWPVLNRHKAALLSQIDYFIDAQHGLVFPWTTGDTFRAALAELSEHPFRARPWFEPGIWGGSWMMEHIPHLPKGVPNYAWSFELISPENGILIEDQGRMLEFSFDWLMFAHSSAVLGKAAETFGTYFPIRFDFLDTFDGDHLSIQCHPSLKYAQENFGEQITQDETYYILDQKEHAGVYIGFTADSDPVSFEKDLRSSYENGTALDIEQHVQLIPAKKHDFFLIPNRTVHSAGINNLVLEISSTPYIFTFKLYDWVRKDLNGMPRPINIDHGMKNIDFSRKGEKVQQELISKPVLLEQTATAEHWHLPTHEEHFYDVERYEWEGTITIETKQHCHILMLVEGSQVQITANGESNIYNYAETIVVPAAVKTYTMTYPGAGRGKVVKAFVKDNSL
ncbi:class I mannose-6-phosphate isomerase [Pedobacter sp. PLR]|uniref:class I mannose-6-phosphate isomerase n=1 Tax=Pedobacter sp. PLR TaxID=2994465 RepID=UPI002245B6D5|nr:class I mannose-6-phosphate isomerase [Pedobacter sp. PLR]MCX2453609.1 class I mannose-6-phosphate isomerase [Pedobacter sp. PLR]